MLSIKKRLNGVLNFNKLYNLIVFSTYTALCFLCLTSFVFAAADRSTITSTIKGMLENVQDDILYISTACLGIAIGSGVLMKKFSMGKQEKIELGNKIIRDSVIGFVLLNLTTQISNYILALTSPAT